MKALHLKGGTPLADDRLHVRQSNRNLCLVKERELYVDIFLFYIPLSPQLFWTRNNISCYMERDHFPSSYLHFYRHGVHAHSQTAKTNLLKFKPSWVQAKQYRFLCS